VVNFNMPQPFYPPGKEPSVPTEKGVVWAPEPVKDILKDRKSLSPNRIRAWSVQLAA
jgi:hypothetical protein